MTETEYNPGPEVAHVLGKAYHYIRSVNYRVTARWVFYRLLQDGTFSEKGDYKRLLGYLSRARKSFYRTWRPDILADDTRRPVLLQRRGMYTLFPRGHQGFETPEEWASTLCAELNCPLDRFLNQPNYVEIWFEASAMQGQFEHYANPNVPLLAFHGDISIPAKWESAVRIYDHWRIHGTPVKILYYGDYDDKGLQIPESAKRDVMAFVERLIGEKMKESIRGEPTQEDNDEYNGMLRTFRADFEFIRVGINDDDIDAYSIPENPERPGTYQWEGLDDSAAEILIGRANDYLDLDTFEDSEEHEKKIAARVREALDEIDFSAIGEDADA